MVRFLSVCLFVTSFWTPFVTPFRWPVFDLRDTGRLASTPTSLRIQTCPLRPPSSPRDVARRTWFGRIQTGIATATWNAPWKAKNTFVEKEQQKKITKKQMKKWRNDTMTWKVHLQMVVSIRRFQSFTWEMGVAPNIYSKIVVWSSRKKRRKENTFGGPTRQRTSHWRRSRGSDRGCTLLSPIPSVRTWATWTPLNLDTLTGCLNL